VEERFRKRYLGCPPLKGGGIRILGREWTTKKQSILTVRRTFKGKKKTGGTHSWEGGLYKSKKRSVQVGRGGGFRTYFKGRGRMPIIGKNEDSKFHFSEKISRKKL